MLQQLSLQCLKFLFCNDASLSQIVEFKKFLCHVYFGTGFGIDLGHCRTFVAQILKDADCDQHKSPQEHSLHWAQEGDEEGSTEANGSANESVLDNVVVGEFLEFSGARI